MQNLIQFHETQTVASGNAKNMMQEKENNDCKQEVKHRKSFKFRFYRALKNPLKRQEKNDAWLSGNESHKSEDAAVITSSQRMIR